MWELLWQLREWLKEQLVLWGQIPAEGSSSFLNCELHKTLSFILSVKITV